MIKSDFFLKDNFRTSGEMLDRHNRPAIETFITENEDEELVIENDPCHCWVCIEDVSDTYIPDGFHEVSQDPEIEETIEDFEETENGNHFGKIISASINVETGIIILHREEIPSETISIDYQETAKEILADDDFEAFYPRIMGKKVLQDDVDYNPYNGVYKIRSHDNLKTMSDQKLQRMCRKQLRAIRRKF